MPHVFFPLPNTLSAWPRGDLICSNYFIDSFSGPYHCSFPSIKHMPRWIMWPGTMGCLLKQKDHRTALLWCMFLSCSFCSFYFLHHTPHTYSALILFHLFSWNPNISLSCFLSNAPASPFFCFFCLMFPGTRAQQAFRTEPKNLTVRMGATAVLRCEVLRASGTVQWAKDGFLLGPERSLPGFPRYSMIGNPERGKPGYSRNMVYGLLSFDGPIKTK